MEKLNTKQTKINVSMRLINKYGLRLRQKAGKDSAVMTLPNAEHSTVLEQQQQTTDLQRSKLGQGIHGLTCFNVAKTSADLYFLDSCNQF